MSSGIEWHQMEDAPKNMAVILLYGERQIECFWSTFDDCWLDYGSMMPVPNDDSGTTPEPDGWRHITEFAS